MRTVILLSLVACGSAAPKPVVSPKPAVQDIDYRLLELPGFALHVPVALGPGAGSIDEYDAGKVKLVGNQNGLTLEWWVGGVDMDMLAALFKSNLPPDTDYEIKAVRTREVNHMKAAQLDARVGAAQIRFVDVGCGRRHVFFTFVNLESEPVLATFECRPDAANESRTVPTATVAVDDPETFAGWSVVTTNDKLSLRKGDVLLVFIGVDNATDAPADVLLSVLLRQDGASWRNGHANKRHVFGTDRELQMGAMERQGISTPGVASAWWCGTKRVYAMGLAIHGSIAPAVDAIVKVRCPKPSDPQLPPGLAR
jgi:hypothetical protein